MSSVREWERAQSDSGLLWEQGAEGSNSLAPTITNQANADIFTDAFAFQYISPTAVSSIVVIVSSSLWGRS